MMKLKTTLFIFFMLGLTTLSLAQEAVEDKKLEEKQRQIQRNFSQLIQSIEKLAANMKQEDPETARRLSDALVELKQLKISDQMEEVIKYIKSKGKYQLSEKLTKLIGNLETVMSFLTLDRASLDKIAIGKAVEKLKKIKSKQAKINEKNGEGKDISKEQKDLREELKKTSEELGKISDDSPFKDVVKEARKDLEEAEKAMRDNEKNPENGSENDPKGQPQDGEPSKSKPGNNKKGDEAEKKVKEAIEKIEEAKKKLEDALKDNEESPDNIVEAIREELRRMIAVQKKIQMTVVLANKEKPSRRVLKRRLAKTNPLIEQQQIDMQKLQMTFAEDGSLTFEMAMGMILEDEMSLAEDLKNATISDISILKGQSVLEALEDMLEALKDLEPLEKAGGGGG